MTGIFPGFRPDLAEIDANSMESDAISAKLPVISWNWSRTPEKVTLFRRNRSEVQGKKVERHGEKVEKQGETVEI